SYGYPNKKPAPIKVQYRSDGQIYKYVKSPAPSLSTYMPGYSGLSGYGDCKKVGHLIGSSRTKTDKNTAN
ncbi:serine protease, partial [Staphylococcus pseudintermedius]